MSMNTFVQRAALLLAFVPQIVLMGMGQSVVVCVGDDGHMQIEVTASGCCANFGEAPVGMTPALSRSESDSDCISCSDIRVVLDPRPARSATVESLGLELIVIQLFPLGIEPIDGSAAPRATVSSEAEAEGVLPQHLVYRRSVQLIC